MSEMFPPAMGVAVGGTADGQFSLLFPIWKSTAERFSKEQIETAALISLYQYVPIGFEPVEGTIDMEWSEEYLTPPPYEPKVLVRVVATLWEKKALCSKERSRPC